MSEENLEPSQSEMSEVVSKSAKKATKRVAKKATKTTAKKATKRTAKKAVKRVAKKTDTAETAVAAAEQADLFESGRKSRGHPHCTCESGCAHVA